MPAQIAASEEKRLRHEDSVPDGAAGLSPAGDETGHADAGRSFSIPAGRTAEASTLGIQFALERLLVDPDFLLRVHRDPVSDLEVASRLSFFLWSSIPDERLLDLAERGQLTKPANLEKEARRMLADPRATMHSWMDSPPSG